MTLGQFIRGLREGRAQTQEEFLNDLKDVLKISQTTLSNWERGNTIPDFIEMCLISRKLKIPLDDIVEKIQSDLPRVEGRETGTGESGGGAASNILG